MKVPPELISAALGMFIVTDLIVIMVATRLLGAVERIARILGTANTYAGRHNECMLGTHMHLDGIRKAIEERQPRDRSRTW